MTNQEHALIKTKSNEQQEWLGQNELEFSKIPIKSANMPFLSYFWLVFNKVINIKSFAHSENV